MDFFDTLVVGERFAGRREIGSCRTAVAGEERALQKQLFRAPHRALLPRGMGEQDAVQVEGPVQVVLGLPLRRAPAPRPPWPAAPAGAPPPLAATAWRHRRPARPAPALPPPVHTQPPASAAAAPTGPAAPAIPPAARRSAPEPGSGAGPRPTPGRRRSVAPALCAGTSGRSFPGRAAGGPASGAAAPVPRTGPRATRPWRCPLGRTVAR